MIRRVVTRNMYPLEVERIRHLIAYMLQFQRHKKWDFKIMSRTRYIHGLRTISFATQSPVF